MQSVNILISLFARRSNILINPIIPYLNIQPLFVGYLVASSIRMCQFIHFVSYQLEAMT
jgi:hypothetical protein